MLPSTPQLLLRPNKRATAAAAYTGPMDIAGYGTAYACYSLRAASAAAAALAGACIDITDQADANATTINLLTNGNIDVASINSWVTAHSVTTIKITKWYDQSGNNRHLLAASTSQSPKLVLSGVGFGSIPTINFDKGADNPYFITSANATAQAQPITVSTVLRDDNGGVFFTDGTFDFDAYVNIVGSGTIGHSFGSRVDYTGAAFGAWASLSSVANGASSTMRVEHASLSTGIQTGNPGTNGIANTNKITMGAGTDAGSSVWGGRVFELIVVASAVSSANQASLATNQRAYGGY